MIQKYAGDLPLITLPAPSYNASLGGDPLPGYRKELRIQYRMNGKEGDVSFAENELIVLPQPN